MKPIEIKDIYGNTRFSTPINKGAKGKFTLMREDYIILPFSVAEPVYFKLGDYVDLSGVLDDAFGGMLSKVYEVVEPVKPTFNTSTGGYDYNLRLDAYYWKWKNKKFKYTPEHAGYEASWSLTAPLDVQMGVFLRNLKALGYTYKGNDFQFVIDSTVENKAVAMTYDNISLLDALFSMAGKEMWNCDCWITDNIIHFGRNEYGDSVKLELGVEASAMTRSESKGTYATRIYAFGSTRNIPENYRPVDEQTVVNGVVQRRLMLPSDTPFIDVYPGMSEEEAIEDVVVFDDVYPHRIGTLSGINTVDRPLKGDNDEVIGTFKAYQYKDTGLDFKDDYILKGQEPEIIFRSGKLNGMKFVAIFEPDGTPKGSQIWEIKANEDYGRLLPDETIRPENGDKYVLTGFDIQLVSDQYVPAAELELKEKALKYADQRKKDDGTYNTTLNSVWVYEDRLKRFYEFGQNVTLVNKAFFEDGRESRILGWEFNLDIPWDSPSYVIGESMPYSRINDIEEKVDSLTYKGQTYTGGGGNGIYVIRTNDTTAPSDSNVFSARRSLSTFLRKDKSDQTNFLIKFLGGLVSDNMQSSEFTSGPFGIGYLVKVDPKTGRSYIEVDELYVRLKAYFDTLEIKKLTHVGGTIVLSPASMECIRVEVTDAGSRQEPLYDKDGGRLSDSEGSLLYAGGNATRAAEKVYRCYFKNTDGTKEITNDFALGDLAQCRTFNVKEGTSHDVSNQYYWRKVVGLGEDYIDLSMSDCDPISGVPQEGDTIATFGNATDPRRQNVVVLAAFGEGSPCITQYSGIDSYSTKDKEVTRISPEGNMFKGSFLLETGKEIKEYISEEGGVVKKETMEAVLAVLPDKISLEVTKQTEELKEDMLLVQEEVAALTVKSNEISSQVVTVRNTANAALDKANAANSKAVTAESIADTARDLAEQASEIGMYGQESYHQSENPWRGWSGGTEYQHVGALWYNPDTDETQVYVGFDGGNKWEPVNEAHYATASYILQNSDKISQVVANFDSQGRPTTASGIITEAYGNTLWASAELEDGEEIVSRINQTASSVTIDARHINLNGVVTANNYFKILTDGSMQSTGGTIGGFKITASSITSSNVNPDHCLTLGHESLRYYHKDSDYERKAAWGASGNNFFPSTLGVDMPLGVYSKASSGASANVGVYIDCNGCSNMNTELTGDIAMYIKSGFISGFRLFTRYVNSNTTLRDTDNVVIAGSGVTTLTLPSNPKEGQMYYIKKTAPNATLRVTASGGKRIHGPQSNVEATTTMGSIYGIILVYQSVVTLGGYNCWIVLGSITK